MTKVVIAAGPRSTPQQALHDFALRWINWSWPGRTEQQRVLASMASGALAGSLRPAAGPPRTSVSSESRPASEGTVELLRVSGAGTVRSGLVLTRETALIGNRPVIGGGHWGVYEGRLTLGPSGWTVSQWSVQR
jgi:hypothetical protein